MNAPLLEVEGLVKTYALPREHLLRNATRVEALRGVSFRVEAGKSFGSDSNTESASDNFRCTIRSSPFA